ncbi:MAG: hypothetical protein EOO45_03905 [Flavobacterium sp.]|nr:MAG: hypothetical protein EOO45_03905 [Flavobacterium sp.]
MPNSNLGFRRLQQPGNKDYTGGPKEATHLQGSPVLPIRLLVLAAEVVYGKQCEDRKQEGEYHDQ